LTEKHSRQNLWRRIFTCESSCPGSRIAIFRNRLHLAANDIPVTFMSDWRAAMRQLSAEARLHLYARSLSRKAGTGIHAAVFYGAFALIAGVVFGTLSIHPF
jgi:hypothetical protein